ncbi:MAG: sulfotransferase family protein [Phycisphaeraceae bacterium]
MARMPDFIIIGAMKCATSTLHEQLAQQPGIFMSEPKEPNFFSDDPHYARGLGWYAGLFADAPAEALCGESSTHYTKLPTYPHTVERMRQHVPEARLVYVMRHPMDRLVSHYIHEWTQRVINVPIDEAVDAHAELIAYSRYAMQLEPFLRAFGPERILPVFSGRLRSAPQDELQRVCRFIGYTGEARWIEDQAPANVSSERLRRSALRETLRDLPGLRRIYRAVLPEPVRERINSFWQMKERPELSSAQRERLTAIFDEDLAQLGAWLGIDDLCCANFKARTEQEARDWAHPTRLAS